MAKRRRYSEIEERRRNRKKYFFERKSGLIYKECGCLEYGSGLRNSGQSSFNCLHAV